MCELPAPFNYTDRDSNGTDEKRSAHQVSEDEQRERGEERRKRKQRGLTGVRYDFACGRRKRERQTPNNGRCWRAFRSLRGPRMRIRVHICALVKLMNANVNVVVNVDARREAHDARAMSGLGYNPEESRRFYHFSQEGGRSLSLSRRLTFSLTHFTDPRVVTRTLSKM